MFNFAIELKDRKAQSPDAIRLIGLAGSFHPPEIGYMIHPGNLSLQLFGHNFI